jgi:hypothetical protein
MDMDRPIGKKLTEFRPHSSFTYFSTPEQSPAIFLSM